MKRWMVLLILALGFTVFSFGAAMMVATKVHGLEIPQSLGQCTALCSELFPGTPTAPPTTPPVVPPVSPPVVPPVVGVLPFPHAIEYERSTDQGGGLPGILFRTLPVGSVTAVSVNGEWARVGTPYKGSPVFILSKPDAQYARPLVFMVKMSDGKTYSAVSGSAATPGGPTPAGIYKNSATYTSYGVRNQGRQAWRISRRGDSLGGGPVKFTFASGKTFVVKSTAKNCRDREDTCNRDSRASMYGFVFKPGNGRPNGEGDSDIGTSHGGIYLHAPFGDSSKTVRMEW